MIQENMNRIQRAVAAAGDHLKDKLPSVEGLAHRNAYAHVWKAIKTHFGVSYKFIPDEQLEDVLALIENCRSNPV